MIALPHHPLFRSQIFACVGVFCGAASWPPPVFAHLISPDAVRHACKSNRTSQIKKMDNPDSPPFPGHVLRTITTSSLSIFLLIWAVFPITDITVAQRGGLVSKLAPGLKPARYLSCHHDRRSLKKS